MTFSRADAVVAAAAGSGVDVCFANPGTTELELVRALDRQNRVRPILGLFEGVCSGAADGPGFAAIAAGLGVPGVQVTTGHELHAELVASFAAEGPRPLDVMLP